MPSSTFRSVTTAAVCVALSLPLAAVTAHATVVPAPGRHAVPGVAAGSVAVETAPVPTSEESLPLDGVDAAALEDLEEEMGAAVAPAVLSEEMPTEDFDLVGVTWDSGQQLGDVSVQVRVHEDGAWSPWEVLPVEDGGPDAGTAEAQAAKGVVGTAPLLTDGADGVQVRLDSVSGGSPEGLSVELVDGGTGSVAAAAESAAPVEPASSGATARGSAVAAEPASFVQTAAAVAAPKVLTRAQWGADENLARGSSQNATVKAMVVHHTASSNSYSTQSTALSQMRSIYAYHTKSLGWADIGYNFVVDKFGTIYEGRRGSITSRPVGAHASGFNTSTMGVSALGNYETAAPSSAMVKSIAQVVAWKLGAHGVSPTASTSLTSAGGTARFAKGRTVSLPTVLQHKDVGYTACPGARLSAQMGGIRTQAAALVKVSSAPVPPPPPAPAPSLVGGVPLVGDWDGNGRDEVGLFKDGRIALRLSSGEVRRYAFGRSTDVPVVGDWDGNGVDSVGVFRSGAWFLRNAHSSGGHDVVFTYGGKGDVPIVGKWNGRSLGVGVVADKGRRYLLSDSLGGRVSTQFVWGRPGDQPIVGDWDGNGTVTPGLKRGATRFLLPSWKVGVAVPVGIGRAEMPHIAGDFDGNRTTTLGVLMGGRTFAWRDDLRSGGATTTTTFTG